MNLMGLDLNAVGNHDFDEGPAELVRMANGGTHPTYADLDGTSFDDADFEFLAANVLDKKGQTLSGPFSVRYFDGVP
ncbi:MAG: 5'-nucleotidase, partial [Acidimicrobiales bacterium]